MVFDDPLSKETLYRSKFSIISWKCKAQIQWRFNNWYIHFHSFGKIQCELHKVIQKHIVVGLDEKYVINKVKRSKVCKPNFYVALSN